MKWQLGEVITVPVRAEYRPDLDGTLIISVLGGALDESCIPKFNLVVLRDKKMVDWANSWMERGYEEI